MSQESPVSVGMQEVKLRSILIFSTIAVVASIIFGLLYLFVIAPSAPGSSAGWFLFAFATGITMIVMPCTLPLAFVIVPLSMGKGVAKGLGIALAFGIGIAITQSLYGVIAALIGGLAINSLGAPLEAVKNWVYLVAGIFALLFALGEIGLLKVRMPTYTGAAPAFIQRRPDITKAFFLGLFLGNIGIGCPHPATPLLLIEAASSGNVAYGWVLFLTHAIGRVLPLLLLSFLGILGVNGLAWLMTRKEAVERATGWAMVFVAGFILTLGLFTHDWWVNSGIHSGLEKITQEAYFNERFNDMLNTSVAHAHGLESGTGMFGLPLWLGNWFLVAVWVIPMWWWWNRKRKAIHNSPSFKLREIESRIDRLEKSRREMEGVIKLDETETEFDLAAHRANMDVLEKARREAEEKVQFGETGALKEPIARTYEARILKMQRNYLILLTVFLSLTFIYFLPSNFYLSSMSGMGDHHAAPADGTAMTSMPSGDGHDMHGGAMPTSAPTEAGIKRSEETAGLPDAKKFEIVSLANGESYDIVASYVKKKVGNRMLRMMAYNGSVPGPFIYGKEGSTVTINFTNNTDIDQTIHSHGIRVDNTSDGTPGVTQMAVKPGESYSYTISFRDAGVAWYHPHTRDDIGQELGLYGNYIADPIDPDYWNQVNRDIPIIIDDALLDPDGTFADFYDSEVTHALLGRFGNTYLVNGEENYVLPMKKGEVVRFFMTNVSNARSYKLSIPGAQIKLVGADVGRFEREFFSDSVTISPAERVVAEVYFKDEGTYRLTHTMPTGEVTLASFAVSSDTVDASYADTFAFARTNADVVSEFSSFRDYAYKKADKRLALTVDPESAMGLDHSDHAHGAPAESGGGHMMADGTMMQGMMGGATGEAAMQWDAVPGADAVNTTKNIIWRLIDEDTGKSNMDIPVSEWTWNKGSLVKISLTNNAMAMHTMQHPIHLHGQRFVELSRNGVMNQNMAWKDTVLVLPGETVDILVDMSNIGEWMLHCHIVEHLFAGMMLQFRVEDENGYANGDEFRSTQKGTVSKIRTDSSVTNVPYNTAIDSKGYTVASDKTSFVKGKLDYAALTFRRADGSPVNLSSEVDAPLSVRFVRSDDAISVLTYPGKTDFPAPLQAPAAVPAPVMPMQGDGHEHLHFRFIQSVYAHGGVEDGHPDAARTYSVPVVFSQPGNYKAFVEFVPEGSTEKITASFSVVVGGASFSVDNFGWTPREKWWYLLSVSIILMIPLTLFVRKYIRKAV